MILFSNKEDSYKYFYYILKGTVHVLELSSAGEEKISSMHHSNEVFGLKKLESHDNIPQRNREARAITETKVLKFSTIEYENIRAQRVLSAAETKIEFLTRYIPGLRKVDQKIIQELETCFQKEKMTKGYRLLQQGKPNDYLYFIFSGE